MLSERWVIPIFSMAYSKFGISKFLRGESAGAGKYWPALSWNVKFNIMGRHIGVKSWSGKVWTVFKEFGKFTATCDC